MGNLKSTYDSVIDGKPKVFFIEGLMDCGSIGKEYLIKKLNVLNK